MTNREHITRRKIQIAFEAIAIEGGILSPECFSKIAHLQSDHQKDSDYKVPKGLNIRDEIGRYYRISQGLWSEFKIHQDSKKFVYDLLKLCFCFDDLLPSKSVTIGERIYPVTHSASEGKIPIVIANKEEGLDSLSVRFGDEHRRRSAFGLIQEYLNASDEVLWGIVSHGESLRILRDNTSLTKPAWIEADLKRIFEEDRFADFAAFWLLFHRSRFGDPNQQTHECILEKWREASRTEGIRAQDHLRIGVEEALEILGQGFLSHPKNKFLRDSLQNGTLTVHAYFQELLRIIYRLIFLLTIEERGLLHAEQISESCKLIYADGYGVKKLRNRAIKRNAYDRFGDLWEVLKIVFKAANTGEPKLGIPALGGLFSESKTPHLDQCYIENRSLLAAVYNFTWLKESSGISRVNWRDMGPEELGSVYEGLLELIPKLTENGQKFTFASKSESKGNERKLTGSYYTPDSLVQCILDTALEPVVEQTIKTNPINPVESLLKLKIIDPACGSGHFLLAAARRVATHVARINVDGTPSERDYRKALRQVISHCIYGVDINLMAVEICKVALWLEAVEPGKPLTFLDHHIKCGNSLLGVTPNLLRKGIPDLAFEPILGDNKKICNGLKKKNKKEREGERNLFSDDKGYFKLGNLIQDITNLNSLQDDNIEGLHEKEKVYYQLIDSSVYKNNKFVCDAWCAAFVWEKNDQTIPPVTTDGLWELEDFPNKILQDQRNKIRNLTLQYNFFHFHLEFPDAFSVPGKDCSAENVEMGWNGGFDVVIGNPPWDQLQFDPQEALIEKNADIANIANKSEREHLINQLEKDDPIGYEVLLKKRRIIDGTKNFVHGSNRFPQTSIGRLNLYSLFAELSSNIISNEGQLGIIIPSGIATDSFNQLFFNNLINSQTLVSLYDFENRERTLFPSVYYRMRFCLLTICGVKKQVLEPDFVFFALNPQDLRNEESHFYLKKQDFELLNPNTKTCPTFRSKKDAEIVKSIYQHIPIISDDNNKNGNDIWGFRSFLMFMMNTDSYKFKTKKQLEEMGALLDKNIFHIEKKIRFLPLYEGRMIDIYDHRFASTIEKEVILKRSGESKELTNEQKTDPYNLALPRYWVDQKDVENANELIIEKGWTLGCMSITSATNERTSIFSIIPRSAIGNSITGIDCKQDAKLQGCLLANCSSYVFDYVCKQKVSGNNFNQFIIKQLPALPPSKYHENCPWENDSQLLAWLLKRIIELVYTSWDLKTFSVNCGYGGPPFIWNVERRRHLKDELDAAYFHLYGMKREQVDYIMDTFSIVKTREIEISGEFHSKNNILKIYDALADAIKTGKPYKTPLDPPPADPRVAHQEATGAPRSM